MVSIKLLVETVTTRQTALSGLTGIHPYSPYIFLKVENPNFSYSFRRLQDFFIIPRSKL